VSTNSDFIALVPQIVADTHRSVDRMAVLKTFPDLHGQIFVPKATGQEPANAQYMLGLL